MIVLERRIKKMVPISIKLAIYKALKEAELMRQKYKHKKALKRLKNTEKIRCVFMALDISAWKYDHVFRLMEMDPRFDPIIFVCPIVNQGREIMLDKLKLSVKYYREKGYKVVCSYDEEKDKYVDLRKELHPDILFYTNPYEGFIDNRFYISHYKDILTVYVSYFFTCSTDMDFNTNVDLYNLVWRKYVENDFTYQICHKYAYNKGRNAVVTGYPGIEPLIDNHKVVDPFNGDSRKRIIWAPHHTLDSSIYGHSCFLMYADLLLELASRYVKDAIFIFKPHPLLKSKLYEAWGKTKTDHYYSQWADGENTSINEGDYYDLFLSSDAMIHDSGSFVVEYLYVNKPVMRTVNDVPLETQFNEFALSCLNQYYLAKNQSDIEQFVFNVVNGIDLLKEKRTRFLHEVLMPKGSPSQNVIDDLKYSIDNQILYHS